MFWSSTLLFFGDSDDVLFHFCVKIVFMAIIFSPDLCMLAFVEVVCLKIDLWLWWLDQLVIFPFHDGKKFNCNFSICILK